MNMTGLRERNKALRRAAITTAAYRLFAERGYDATTIADIADAAGVAPRTVSLYFPTKQEIALAGVGDVIERLIVALRRRPPGESMVTIIGAWLRDELINTDSELIELAHRMFEANPELRALTMARKENMFVEGARAVSEELGVDLNDVRTRVAVAAIAGIVEFVLTSSDADAIDETVETAVAFLTAGLDCLRSSDSDRRTSI